MLDRASKGPEVTLHITAFASSPDKVGDNFHKPNILATDNWVRV